MANFSDEDIKLAQKVQKEYGVPASVVLAQYGLESGYGKSTVGKNNYFNIKGNGNGGYRDYSSKEESFMDYGKLLNNERYTQYTKNAKSAEEYINGVKKGGYAEDPNYTNKIMEIIMTNELTKYDDYKFIGYVNPIESGVEKLKDSNGIKWWGDIVIVTIAILLVILGVVFLGMVFIDKDTIKKVKSVKRGA